MPSHPGNTTPNQGRLKKAWGLRQNIPFWSPLSGRACLGRFETDWGSTLFVLAVQIWSLDARFQFQAEQPTFSASADESEEEINELSHELTQDCVSVDGDDEVSGKSEASEQSE